MEGKDLFQKETESGPDVDPFEEIEVKPLPAHTRLSNKEISELFSDLILPGESTILCVTAMTVSEKLVMVKGGMAPAEDGPRLVIDSTAKNVNAGDYIVLVRKAEPLTQIIRGRYAAEVFYVGHVALVISDLDLWNANENKLELPEFQNSPIVAKPTLIEGVHPGLPGGGGI